MFKGPMLSLGGHHGGSPSTSRVRGENGSRSGSVQGRKSGEIIMEEEEEEEEAEEDIEEVEEFSPLSQSAEEIVEESKDENGENEVTPKKAR